MIPINPCKELHIIPPDATEVRYAEHQPEYVTLPSIRTPDGRVLSQWRLDPNEIELIKNGVPVTLVLHTFNEPLQPIQLVVGGFDLRT